MSLATVISASVATLILGFMAVVMFFSTFTCPKVTSFLERHGFKPIALVNATTATQVTKLWQALHEVEERQQTDHLALVARVEALEAASKRI